MLSVLDNAWKEHLSSMDYLRQGIYLRGYAQKQPKQEFKREAFELFELMLDRVKHEIIQMLARVRIRSENEVQAMEEQQQRQAQARQLQFQHAEAGGLPAGEPEPQADPQVTIAQSPVHRDAPKVGRNDPCPCGSGKKYKKCHLAEASTPSALPPSPSSASPPSKAHRVDERIVHELHRYGAERCLELLHAAASMFGDPEKSLQLLMPWSVYAFAVDGRTVADRFLEARAVRLSNEERSWLEAQRSVWLSIWEVAGVDPGRSLTLRDLLTGEERCVAEVSGSRTAALRDTLLARVIDHRGESLLCGAHPRLLGPEYADRVVQRCRKKLRLKKNVPPNRMLGSELQAWLIGTWEEEVAELDAERAVPPRLHNTDGDPFLLTKDRFTIDRARGEEIRRALSSIPGLDELEDGSYQLLRDGNALHKDWDNTVIGRIELKEGQLMVETNSVRRANALRAQVEAALGALATHRLREHDDPLSSRQRGKPNAPAHEPQTPPEMLTLLVAMKSKHYETWADTELPALSGQTPKHAARTKQGRARVDVLLREMENHEARLPLAERFDFSDLRRSLGLEH
jgi:hypothetical protein